MTSLLLVSDWLIKKMILGHCLHSECQIIVIFTFVGISTDGYYVAVNASIVRLLTFNDHLEYHKINNLRILTINNKISKNANFAP